jgi:phosphoribosylamine--glycine ligase
MGAYSPVPWFADPEALVEQIHQPVIDELARRGTAFVGCLFAGLIVTPEGPKVLEFNARFGDPETQALMPRVDCDLLEVLAAGAHGDLGGAELPSSPDAAVSVVLAGPDYPARSDFVGAPIAGVEAAEAAGALVFHGGTAVRGDALVANGGRILSVTGLGGTVAEAREHAYAAAGMIQFEGARHRTDIAAVVDG